MVFKLLAEKKMSWNAVSNPTKPITYEELEPRILLSGDSLQNIAPDPLEQVLLDSAPQAVQEAEILETTNIQVEERIDQESPPSDIPDSEIYPPVLTLSSNDREVLYGNSNSADINLSDNSAEPQPEGTIDLPGMHLVDPTVDYFDGQIIYLDFDGEQDVTYNGPVVVEDINIPEFSADAAGLAGQESEIISQILSTLEGTFEGSGVYFTTTLPLLGTEYSTIFIGGDDSAFVEYGSFMGLAEQVDIGNQDSNDNGFVFSNNNIIYSDAEIGACITYLSDLISHETGHLLGYEHDHDHGRFNEVNTSHANSDLSEVASLVTLITHGFQSNANTWVSSMANEIAMKDGGVSQVSKYTMVVNNGFGDGGDIQVESFSLDPNSPDRDETLTGDAIIKIDWSDLDGGLGFGISTTAVARAVADELLSSQDWIFESQMHFIGHSRGASLIGALAEDLGEHGIWVDQLTFLDTRPTENLIGHEDWGEDTVMYVPGNVRFADSYYRKGSVVNGEHVFGAKTYILNNDFFETADNGGYGGGVLSGDEHSDVHLWYHGTIDTEGDFDDIIGGEGASVTSAQAVDWYSSDNVTPEPDPDNGEPVPERDEIGYYYSRIVGGDRPSEGISPLFGGSAARDTITDRTGEQWANIDDIVVNIEGDTLDISFRYMDYYSSEVTFWLDNDANSYNGNTGINIYSDSLSRSIGAFGTGNFTWTLPSQFEGGEYYIVGSILSKGNTRCAYSSDKILLQKEDSIRPPANLEAQALSHDEIKLTWTDDGNNLATHFYIKFSLVPIVNGTLLPGTSVAIVDVGDEEYIHNRLMADTQYYYIVYSGFDPTFYLCTYAFADTKTNILTASGIDISISYGGTELVFTQDGPGDYSSSALDLGTFEQGEYAQIEYAIENLSGGEIRWWQDISGSDKFEYSDGFNLLSEDGSSNPNLWLSTSDTGQFEGELVVSWNPDGDWYASYHLTIPISAEVIPRPGEGPRISGLGMTASGVLVKGSGGDYFNLDIDFDKAMDFSAYEIGRAISLKNNNGTSVPLASVGMIFWWNDFKSTSFQLFNWADVPLGTYTLTIDDFWFRDKTNATLDGEWSGSWPSGDGVQGGDFVYTFEVIAAPPKPSRPQLLSVDDTGYYNYDGLTSVETPTIEITCGAAAEGLHVYVDGRKVGDATKLSATTWRYTFEPGEIQNGNQRVTARASILGAEGAASSYLYLTLDKISPPLPIVPELAVETDSGIQGDFVTNVARPKFVGSVEARTEVLLYIDGELAASQLLGSGISEYVISPGSDLEDGWHYATIAARDLAGNVSEVSGPCLFTLDTQLPNITSTPPDMVDVGVTYSYLPQIDSPDDIGTLTWIASESPQGLTVDPETGSISWIPTSVGESFVSLKVTDVAGNETLQEWTITVYPPNVAPIVNAGSDILVAEGQTINLDSATFTDLNPEDTHTATINWGDGTIESGIVDQDSHTVSGSHVYADDNTYSVTVTVNDDDGGSGSDALIITVNDLIPTVDLVGDATLNENQSGSFDASGSTSSPDAIVSYEWDWNYSGTFNASGDTGSTQSHTWLDDGTPVVAVRVTDDDGSTDIATLGVTVNEVNTAPDLATIGDKSIDEGIQLTFTASATDSDIPANALTFSLFNAPSGASIDPDTGEFTWTPSETQGPDTYDVTVRVTDNGTPSLYNEETITITVNEVNNPPELATIGNKIIDEGDTLTFTASATDSDLPANALTFSLFNAPAGASIDPDTGEFTWTPSEDQGPDTYDVTVRVTDDGTPNLYNEETITITVNEVNTAPELAAIGDKEIDEGDALTFTASASDGDIPANSLTFSLFNAPTGASIDPDTGEFTWTPSEVQGNDTFDVTVKITDNGSPSLYDEETITITVNEVNITPELAAIGNQSIDEGSLLTFTASATDSDLPANALTFSLFNAPTGATIDPDTGEFNWTPSESQNRHSYTLTIRVTDNGLLNLYDEETIEITVGRPPVLASIGDKEIDEGYALTFTASVTDSDVPLDALTFSLINAPTGAGIDPDTGEFIWTPNEEQGYGNYNVTVRVTDDELPDLYDKETITITVNEINNAPELTAIGNKEIDEGSQLTFTTSATDSDIPANVLTFTLFNAPAGASIDPDTGEFAWTPSENQGSGTYEVTVRVTDNGTPNLYDEEIITITVNEVNIAPVLDPIGNQTVDEGSQLTFTADATDSDIPANALSFSLINAPSGASIDPDTGEFIWTPSEGQGPGSYDVTIRVTDDGTPNLYDEEIITITVNEVNITPELAAIGNKEINEGSLLTFTASATDSDIPANSLTFSLINAPTGASIDPDTGEFTWAPSEDQGPGSYEVIVKVTDNGTPNLYDEETITITVNEVNIAPELAAIGNQTIDEGSLLTFTASAIDSDIPGNILTFGLINAPAGASIDPDTGEFTWTPTEDQGYGSYNVTVRVTDDGTPNLYDEEIITITVNEVNIAPELAAIGNQITDEGDTLTFTASATDSDIPGNALTFSLINAPAGAGIDPDTGVFTWTSNEDQGPGSYEVTVRVTDDGTPNLYDEETITITVNEVNTAPELAAVGNKEIDEGSQLTFTASATDSDIPGNALTFSLINAPAGAGIDPDTGEFTWTPNEDQGPGSYEVTVRVTDDGTPNLYDEETITITVNEVNTAPELAAIGDKTVIEEYLLTFTASATDSDSPINSLTYSLIDAPEGATIDPVSGVFTWTPAEGWGSDSYDVTVRVTDDSTPNLYDEETITIDYVICTAPEGTNISTAENPSPDDFPEGMEVPYGFFDFTINVTTGGAAIVTLTLPGNVSSYYKYGSTPDNHIDHWYEFTYDGETGAQINGNEVTLHFVDGQRGDDDITANGIIVDPGGPVIIDNPLMPIEISDKNTTPSTAVNMALLTSTKLSKISFSIDEEPFIIISSAAQFYNNDPFVVLESAYDFSPIAPIGFMLESFGVSGKIPSPPPLAHGYIEVPTANIDEGITILYDDNGIQLANLQAFVNRINVQLTETQITKIDISASKLKETSTGAWLDALVVYIDTLINEQGLSVDEAIARAIEEYAPRLIEAGDEEAAKVIMFIKMYVARERCWWLGY